MTHFLPFLLFSPDVLLDCLLYNLHISIMVHVKRRRRLVRQLSDGRQGAGGLPRAPSLEMPNWTRPRIRVFILGHK